MAKKLIAIDISGTDEEALAVANAVWQTVVDHLGEDRTTVAVQGFPAPGWDEFDGEIRLTETKTKTSKRR